MDGLSVLKLLKHNREIILSAIEAKDHFSTNDRREFDSGCIFRCVGELLGETDQLLILRHVKADINDEDSGEEFHCILKDNILYRRDVVVGFPPEEFLLTAEQELALHERHTDKQLFFTIAISPQLAGLVKKIDHRLGTIELSQWIIAALTQKLQELGETVGILMEEA